MNKTDHLETYHHLKSKLKIECSKCSGLCCTALYCTKTDGFPEDKAAGVPCVNLMPDFRCAIHSQLKKKQMRGCLAYDCFGAGQAVTQMYPHGKNWKENPKQAEEIFNVYLYVLQLHQMLWYLTDAFSATLEIQVKKDIEALILENEQMTSQPPAAILAQDLDTYRTKVNTLLKQVIKHMSANSASGGASKKFFGKNFKKTDLEKTDFSMSLMIAANLKGCHLRGSNFLGADLRDAVIEDTDLSECLFLTQMQINSAKGNANTKLPAGLCHPVSW